MKTFDISNADQTDNSNSSDICVCKNHDNDV